MLKKIIQQEAYFLLKTKKQGPFSTSAPKGDT